MFKIGDFSKISRVSVRMLRYYDENDIFKPDAVDYYTGYRYYSARQINEINKIITLWDYGFNVLQIGAFMSADTQVQENMLRTKQTEIQNTIINEKHNIDMITSAIKNLYKEKVTMEYKVEIKSIPSIKAIALRDKIPAYDSEGMLWDRISRYVEEHNVKLTGYCYATYYDTEYKEGDVDVEVLMEVTSMGKSDGEFIYKQTDAIGKAACIMVPGEYSNIGKAFAYLGEWLEQNNKKMAGRMRQVPIRGPWNENDPKDYLTEIQCPIE